MTDAIARDRRVWAIVVTWKSPALTTRLIEYVADLWPDDVHVVLVECGPESHHFTEGTRARITVLRAGANLGYAGGNNLGIRYAIGAGATHVLLLNSDAFPLHGSLDRLSSCLDDDRTIGACGATLVSWLPGTGVEVNSGTAFDWTTGRTHPAGLAAVPKTVDFACGAMVLFQREALENVGALDSNLFLFYEEIDWCERARRLGYRIVVHPSARALHLGSQSVRRAPRAAAFYQARNRAWIMRRYITYGSRRRWTLQFVIQSGRAVAGLLLRRRFSLVWPTLAGTVAGLRRVPVPSDSPFIAAQHARFEASDA